MSHIGRETYVEVGPNRYRLSRYTREMDEQFVKWAMSTLPDPLEQAKKDIQGFSPEIANMIVREALATKRKRDTGMSEDVQAIRSSQKGQWKMLSLLFQKHNPELSERDVGNVFDEILEQHGEEYLVTKLQEAMGVVKAKDLPDEPQKKTN